jgi:hypothetical protein
MGFFGLLFLIAVFWMVIRAWRKSERCVAMGPAGYGPGWYGGERQGYPETRVSSEWMRSRADSVSWRSGSTSPSGC